MKFSKLAIKTLLLSSLISFATNSFAEDKINLDSKLDKKFILPIDNPRMYFKETKLKEVERADEDKYKFLNFGLSLFSSITLENILRGKEDALEKAGYNVDSFRTLHINTIIEGLYLAGIIKKKPDVEFGLRGKDAACLVWTIKY